MHAGDIGWVALCDWGSAVFLDEMLVTALRVNGNHAHLPPGVPKLFVNKYDEVLVTTSFQRVHLFEHFFCFWTVEGGER